MADMTTTWEDGARAAADAVLDKTGDGLLTNLGNSFLDEIDRFLTDLRNGELEGLTFHYIADDALQAYVELTTSFLEDARDRAIALVVDTIISKQHDYGHDNILWGGVEGIVLRMHDKTARIRNLQERGHHGFTSGAPLNEPLADSWLDLVGYALIGIMLQDGSFNLPLARDANEQEWNDVEATPPTPHDDVAPEWEFTYHTVPVNIAGLDCVIGDWAAEFQPNADCPRDTAFLINPAYVTTVPSDFYDELVDDFPYGHPEIDPPECAFDDEDTYDEAFDPELWGLFTESQHVFVGTYLSGWGDGAPRVGVFAKGKGSDQDAHGAYFTLAQLAELIDYLMMTHAFCEAYVVHNEAADAIDTLAPHVVVSL